MALKMTSNDENVPFAYIWAIEKFHVFHDPECIPSPTFTVKSMERTKWRLELDISYDWIRCSLIREFVDCGPDGIDIEFEVSLLEVDGSPLISKKEKHLFLNFGKRRIDKLAKVNEVFLTRRSNFMPKDILTVKCRMWRLGTEISSRNLCFARTRMAKETRSFVWAIKNFRVLPPGGKRYRTRFTFKSKFLIDFTLFLRNDYVCIDVEINCDMSPIYFSSVISIFDIHGKSHKPANLKRLFTSSKTCSKLISKEELKNFKDLIPDDVLSLRIEYELGIGIDSSEIECYRLGCVEEMVEEMSNLQVFDKSADSCCTLKSSVGDLLNNSLFSDLKIKCNDKSFDAHKNILSVRAPEFYSFLKEVNNSDNSMDSHTMNSLLQYIYTDTVLDLDWKGALSLMKEAKRFRMEQLKAKCIALVKSNLTLSNVCEVIVIANSIKDDQLQEDVVKFISKLDGRFFSSDNWRTLTSENKKLAQKFKDAVKREI